MVMFLTGSYTPKGQRTQHIRYVPEAACPSGSAVCMALRSIHPADAELAEKIRTEADYFQN